MWGFLWLLQRNFMYQFWDIFSLLNKIYATTEITSSYFWLCAILVNCETFFQHETLWKEGEYFCYFPVLVWVPKLWTFITDLCLAPFAHLKSRCFFEFQNNWLIKNRFCCYFTWIVKQDVFRRSKQEKSFRVNVCKAHDTDYMNYILLNISLFYLIRFLWVYL